MGEGAHESRLDPSGRAAIRAKSIRSIGDFLEIGLSLSLLGRHFLQGHLFPNAFPQTGVTLVNPCQFMKGNPTLLSLIVMTVHTVLGQKGHGPGLKLG